VEVSVEPAEEEAVVVSVIEEAVEASAIEVAVDSAAVAEVTEEAVEASLVVEIEVAEEVSVEAVAVDSDRYDNILSTLANWLLIQLNTLNFVTREKNDC
jgi:hypothetical protein